MRKYLLTAGALLLASMTWSQTKSLEGFNEAAAKDEMTREEQFDSYLKASDVDSFMKTLSAHPHHVGSPGDKANAEYLYNLFKSWGYDVQTETFYVLFPTPKERLLEMTGPTSYKAVLAEPALKEDATSGQTREQLPTYNCYSPDGDVTGELVFVN